MISPRGAGERETVVERIFENPSRRLVVGAAGAAMASALCRPALAAFPEKPVTLVVPFPPGGPNDIIGRLVGQMLSEAFGQQAVVENRPGAGGATAVGAVSRADPDGYTVVLPSGVGFVTHPMLTPNASYKIEAMRAISNVTSGPSVLAVHPSLEAKTVKELVALAKAKPGALTYASSGVGTTLHLGGELFRSMAGIDVVHVPYKGTSEVVVDLIAGRVDMSFISPLVARKLVDDGKLVALATTGKTPAKGWESTPVVAEAVPGYELDGWYPLLAPAGTPDDAVKRMNEAVAAGVRKPEAAKRLTELGFTPIGSSIEEVQALQAAEAEKWGKLIKEAGLKAG
jgi:tripartite-type tricarboxylate transporter receptor subunit TctC